MVYVFFCEFGLYNGVILTIVVLGRCYCQFLVDVVLLMADGKPLRPILNLNTK